MVGSLRRRIKVEGFIRYISIGFVCLICILPVIWMFLTSLKPQLELVKYPPTILPNQLTFQAYYDLLTMEIFPDFGFKQWLINSLVVSLATCGISITIASLAAYSLSRFKFRGNKLIRYSILITQMLPGALMLLPLYFIMRDLKLLDSLLGLVFAYSTFTLPFSTYMLKGYYDTIPPDLDEIAMIDGCTRLGALFRVVFPLAGPGIAVVIVFSFIQSWNEYLFALAFINSYKNWTVPLALGTFRGQYLIDWTTMFAASVLVSLPVLVIFLILQRKLISGLTAGAVKG